MLRKILAILILTSCSAKKSENESRIVKVDTAFYESGNPKSLTNYINGKVNGHRIEFYDEIDTFLFERNDEYYKGFEASIKKYSFFYENEKISFEWKYDSNNIVYESFGSALISFWAPDSIPAGNKFAMLMLVPCPPKSNGTLTLRFKSKNYEKTHIQNIDECNLRFDTVFQHKGIYNVIINSRIESSNSNIVEEDSIKFILKVNDYQPQNN